MALFTFSGTKITGTSTAGKVFKDSGIYHAYVGYYYRNTENGHYYKCVKGGDPKTAQWAYVRTNIIKGPKSAVTGLTLKRSGSVITASWKVPSDATKATNCARAQKALVFMSIAYSRVAGYTSVCDYFYGKEYDVDISTTQFSFDLSNFELRDGRVIDRNKFHPLNSRKYLVRCLVFVRLKNSCGFGDQVKKAFELKAPDMPKMTEPSFDVDTGTVSVTVTAAKDDGAKERRWTHYETDVYDMLENRARTESEGHSTSSSFTLSYDVENYQSLGPGQYVRVGFFARSEGFMGNASAGWKYYYVSFPRPVTIHDSADRRIKVTSRDSSGKVVVPISVANDETFPVDALKLQKLANVPYPTPESIPGDAEWSDAGPTDDGDCTALVAQVADLMPEAGKHSYIRVKAWHGSENALYSYSRAVEVPLYTEPPSAHDDECAVTSLAPGEDGTSLECVVAWDSRSTSGDDDATGVEVSWSEHAGAWRSTSQPQTFDVEWQDETVDPSASASWRKSAHLTIRGLSEGQAYHVRARCYLVIADSRTYGPHCDAAVAQTRSEPPSVVLKGPASVAPGEGVALSWELASAWPQKSWMVVARVGSGANRTNFVVASGEGAAGGCTVPASAVALRKDGGTFTCHVSCSTGSEYVDSQPVSVIVAVPPTLSVTASDVTAQPASFAVESDQDAIDVSYTVTADGGSTGDAEVGVGPQPGGDVVAAGTARLSSMSRSGGAYHGTVSLGDGLDLRDGCTYAVRATARAAGALESEPAEDGFAVAWGHQAPEPPHDVYARTSDASPVDGKRYYVWDSDEQAYVQADPVDPSSMSTYYEDTGIAVEPYEDETEAGVERGCRLFLNPPSGAASGDLYDVYRLTHDGPELAYEGAPLQCVLTDPLAPYGDAGDFAYRVACRTADGDRAWADFEYALDCRTLRIDWPSGHVELPYDIGISDGYEKDVEVQRRMDGSDVALYGPGHARTASLSTNVLRVEDPATASALRALARHAGTCWVRTPDGSAYEADVQVRSMEVGAQVAAVALEARRVTATGAYDIPSPDEEEEDEDE